MKGGYFLDNIIDRLVMSTDFSERYKMKVIQTDSKEDVGRTAFIGPIVDAAPAKFSIECIDEDKAFTLLDVLYETGYDVSLNEFTPPLDGHYNRNLDPILTDSNNVWAAYQSQMREEPDGSASNILIPMQIIATENDNRYRLIFLENDRQLDYLDLDILRNPEETDTLIGINYQTYLSTINKPKIIPIDIQRVQKIVKKSDDMATLNRFSAQGLTWEVAEKFHRYSGTFFDRLGEYLRNINPSEWEDIRDSYRF